jgi:hypothetical protein
LAIYIIRETTAPWVYDWYIGRVAVGGSQTATHPFAMGLNIILSPKCARMGLKEIRSRETGKNIHTGIYRGDTSNENMRIEPTKSRDIMISRILRYHAV